MARELGKKMANAAMKVQRYGRGQTGRGALTDGAVSLFKSVAGSAPVREAGNAALRVLTKCSLAKLAGPKKFRRERRRKGQGERKDRHKIKLVVWHPSYRQ